MSAFPRLDSWSFQMEEDLETDGGEGATNCHVGDRGLEDDINVSLEELPHQGGASVRYSKILAINICSAGPIYVCNRTISAYLSTVS